MTQVIATIWKKPYNAEKNQAMIDAGVNVFRIKCSHHSAEEISDALIACRKQIKGTSVQLLADLPEAKIRLGDFSEEVLALQQDAVFHFRHANTSPSAFDFVPVKDLFFFERIAVGDHFYTGDGQLQFCVTQTDVDSFTARASCAGTLIQRSALTCARISDQLDHVTDFLRDLVVHLPKSTPDIVAFSFVHSGEMMQQLLALLEPHLTREWSPDIVAKIESMNGVERIDEILPFVDGIMIARGDLGLHVPIADLGVIQKRLTRKAQAAGKYVIVATQMLQTMLEHNIPSRSDVLDATNAVLDGVDAIMLCQETSHHAEPANVVHMAKRIIQSTFNSF